MKYKKYNRMKRAVIAGASSGIVAGMLIMGVSSTALAAETADYISPAYSQSTQAKGMHMMHRWNSGSRATSLAVQLGLDPEEVASEIKAGKSMKQILQDNGIVPEEIQKAFENRKSSNKRAWKMGSSNTK